MIITNPLVNTYHLNSFSLVLVPKYPLYLISLRFVNKLPTPKGNPFGPKPPNKPLGPKTNLPNKNNHPLTGPQSPMSSQPGHNSSNNNTIQVPKHGQELKAPIFYKEKYANVIEQANANKTIAPKTENSLPNKDNNESNKPKSPPYLPNKPPSSQSFKNYADKTYETTINEYTSTEDITQEQLSSELKKRLLIKEQDPSAVKVLLETNEEVLVGIAKNNIKLTKHGQLYYAKIKENQSIPVYPLPETFGKFNPYIIVPPKGTNDLFIETSNQKHMLIVHNESTDEYYITHYLTGNQNNKLLTEKKVHYFVKEKENKSTDNASEKGKQPQYYVTLAMPQKIKKEDFRPIKWSNEYIASIPQLTLDILHKQWEALINTKVYQKFNKEGITLKDGIAMCQEHDRIAGNKKLKHPLSEEEAKLSKEAKLAKKNEET